MCICLYAKSVHGICELEIHFIPPHRSNRNICICSLRSETANALLSIANVRDVCFYLCCVL